MLELLLGPAGGVVGVVGALVKHGLEIWQEDKKAKVAVSELQERNRHELAMADKEAELIKLEASNALVLAELNKSKEFDNNAFSAMTASYDADKATYSNDKKNKWLVAVDVVRGLIRPFLTMFFALSLVIFATWIWLSIPSEVVASQVFLKETFYRLVDSLIFLSTSSCGWWFAARQITKN